MLSVVAIAITIFVYGVVAIIVKIDDLGLYLLEKKGLLRPVGQFLLWLAPVLMKTLTLVGTLAMFLVGGGILSHGVDQYAQFEVVLSHMHFFTNPVANSLAQNMFNACIGVLAGGIAVAVISRFHPYQHHASEKA